MMEIYALRNNYYGFQFVEIVSFSPITYIVLETGQWETYPNNLVGKLTLSEVTSLTPRVQEFNQKWRNFTPIYDNKNPNYETSREMDRQRFVEMQELLKLFEKRVFKTTIDIEAAK